MSDETTLDVATFGPWLAQRAPVTLPVTASLIAGGRSNLTYLVTDADASRFVVRRPPLGPLLPGAHDMNREYGAMAALADTDVPVPSLIGIEEGDDTILGVPFYCMRFVEGIIVRTEEEAAQLPVQTRRNAATSLAQTLAALHRVDPDAVGLGPREKGENYIARQLHVWKRQLDMCVLRPTPFLTDVHAQLEQRIPPQQTVAIVHGDYRLDNAMIDDSGTVVAVLDWELRTLGDPLADLAITLAYWGQADDETIVFRPTIVEGFGTRQDFLATYEAAGGPAMPDQHRGVYMAFAVWRLAAILEGVYQRNLSGQYGETEDEWRHFEDVVPQLAAVAAAHLKA